MAHLIFLTGTPATIADGSGTWVGISVLREAIERLGHEVTLIAPSDASPDTTLSRILFNLGARSTLRRLNADLLAGFDLDGVFLGPLPIPHFAVIKGVLGDEANFERGASRLVLAVQARFERRHVRHADGIVTSSNYSRERIARLYDVGTERISVVPEPIDLEAWRRALREAPLEEGPARILCVAHLYLRKGIDRLLGALARLESGPVLRIVGTGPERFHLEHLARDLGISDRVTFLGHLPFSALAAEYRNATLFALPTAQEGFGIVFLEAMASSLPVVATCAAAVPEVVGGAACLVLPDDEIALADSLARLLADPSMRHSMAEAGIARVQQYDAPIVARRFLTAVGIAAA